MSGIPDNFKQLKKNFGFWIFIVVCAYFISALYWLIQGVLWGAKLVSDQYIYQRLVQVPWWMFVVYASELGGVVCVAFRLMAGFFALYSAIIFWRKGESPLIRGKVGKALIFEGAYYLALIPTVVLGFVYPLMDENLWYFDTTPGLIVLLLNGIVCLMMVAVISPLLFWLGLKILRGSSTQEIVKWSCIVGVSYLFVVFWFNYSMAWAASMVPYWRVPGQYGIGVLIDPINFVGFVVTVFGLLLIAGFALKCVLPVIRKGSVEFRLKRLGTVMTSFGFYFILILILYLLAGGYHGRPAVWMEILGPVHNPDLWCLSFLLLGLRLLMSRSSS
ncbi:MAG: hypothetical protein QXR45_07640 [Candidatus Bathyarchaeia archaeon]